MEGLKDFFVKLQALEEPAKTRVLIVATAIVMVIVIYFWLAYFNSLVAGGIPPATVAENPTAGSAAAMPTQAQAPSPASEGENGGGSIWDNFKNEAAFISGGFMNMAHGLSDILQAPRQYIVKPPQ